MLCALKRDQHIQIACTFLTKSNQWLVLRGVVPSVQGVHVWEFYNYDSLRLPMASLGHFVASALSQVAPPILSDHRAHVGPVLLKLGRVMDDALNNQVSSHVTLPPFAMRHDRNASYGRLLTPHTEKNAVLQSRQAPGTCRPRLPYVAGLAATSSLATSTMRGSLIVKVEPWPGSLSTV